MVEVKALPAVARYAPCRSEGGEWRVVDQASDHRTVLSCPDAPGAALIAALMNGDVAALAHVTPETMARCRAALGEAMRLLRPNGRPLVGLEMFPRL